MIVLRISKRVAIGAVVSVAIGTMATVAFSLEPPTEVRQLVATLKSNRRSDLRRALRRLSQLGPAAHSAVPALIPYLADTREVTNNGLLSPAPESTVADEVAIVLTYIGKASLPALAEYVTAESTRPAEKRRALGIIRAIGIPDAEVIRALREVAKDEDAGLAVEAARTLAELVPSDPESISLLIRLLSNGDPGIRALAAQTLGGMGKPAKAAVPHLVNLLKSEEDVATGGSDAIGWTPLKEFAIAAIRDIGYCPREASKAISDRLDDKYESTRVVAASAALKFGIHRKKALDILARAVDRDADSLYVLQAIAKAGPGASPLAPRLKRIAKANALYCSCLAWECLLQYENPPAFEDLRAWYESLEDGLGRECAIKLIARSFRDVPGVCTFVKECLSDPDDSVRWAAVKALGIIDIPAASRRDMLERVVRQDDSAFVRHAARTLLEKNDALRRREIDSGK